MKYTGVGRKFAKFATEAGYAAQRDCIVRPRTRRWLRRVTAKAVRRDASAVIAAQLKGNG